MKYDDASWHYGGEFPEGQPIEHGGTHIALFLKWCFFKGWASKFHMKNEAEAVADVVSGKLSATEFLFQYCDGKLTDEDLNKKGNSFARRYYGKNGLYLYDYGTLFADLMYIKPEAEHDFEKFSSMLEARYRSGELTKTLEPTRSTSLYTSGDKQTGRNEPCPCGSGKKYKQCCGSIK